MLWSCLGGREAWYWWTIALSFTSVVPCTRNQAILVTNHESMASLWLNSIVPGDCITAWLIQTCIVGGTPGLPLVLVLLRLLAPLLQLLLNLLQVGLWGDTLLVSRQHSRMWREAVNCETQLKCPGYDIALYPGHREFGCEARIWYRTIHTVHPQCMHVQDAYTHSALSHHSLMQWG